MQAVHGADGRGAVDTGPALLAYFTGDPAGKGVAGAVVRGDTADPTIHTAGIANRW
jgi:hypothetical protein